MAQKIKGLNHITGSELLKLPAENIIFIDVRPEYMRSKLFDVPNLLNYPYTEIENWFNNIPPDSTLVIADAVGIRSKEVAIKLLKAGFNNVYNLVGGIVEWERNHLPIINDKSKVLSGSCMCQLKVRNK
ncbi:MAG: rhodanese-like domain-containing protein [Salinivirgaceae bacterium]